MAVRSAFKSHRPLSQCLFLCAFFIKQTHDQSREYTFRLLEERLQKGIVAEDTEFTESCTYCDYANATKSLESLCDLCDLGG